MTDKVNEGTEIKNTAQQGATTEQDALKNDVPEVESRAMEQGWQPEEEWVAAGKDPSEWRDARSFLDRGELLNRISAQSKEMKELRRTLKVFEEHNKKLADQKFKEKYNELKNEKKEALESGDAQRVVELDEQLDLVKDHMAENQAATVVNEQPEMHPDFQRWIDRNSWYGQDSEMKDFADSIGTAYAKSNRNKTPNEVLQYVEQRVKKTYSERFPATRRDAPSTVETGGGSRRMASKRDEVVMSAEEEQVMNTLVRGGHMTKEEYIKQLKLVK